MTEQTPEIRVKNWERFQHYKDRSPPWIKLYNDLLDDYRFTRLQDASKMHLVGIWLLASRLANRVPADPQWIADKIGATDPVDLNELVSAGFISISGPQAECLQDASEPLALARASEEAETETDNPPVGPPESRSRSTALPDGWQPNANHLERADREGVDCSREAEKFRAHHRAKGSTFKSWDQAFTTWLLKAGEFAERDGTKPTRKRKSVPFGDGAARIEA